MLYDIKFWNKTLQSLELTFYMVGKSKSWAYDDVDE